ncbi:MAG: IPT/TIG domain-containing protein [Candidatus Uhrbacteria bacterium]|nr:IPT/TIG domain-containing protein [Candidatus Uhrbacteria bacterium]
MKGLKKKNLFKLFGLAILAGGFLFSGGFAWAQDVAEIATTAGLGGEDITIIIARIIRVALGFLGIIAVIIVLYAGFLWMTAGGKSEQVEKAKKWMINGVIGTVIILLSYSIASFVLSALISATGTGSSGGSGSGSGSGSGLGGGSVATFSVSAFRPEGEVSIRNIQLQVTFSRDIDETTTEAGIIVTNSDTGEEVEGTISVSGNKITFVPTATCPEPNNDRFCFDENTSYDVEVNSAIESTRGVSLTCSGESCNSTFTSGDIIDVDDPIVNLTAPDSGDRLEPDVLELLQATAIDDSQIATGDFAIDDDQIDSVPADGDDLSSVTLETIWDTSAYEDTTTYTVSVTATDIAGNEDTDSVRVRINPAHCYNRLLNADEGEEGIDCGGECGACDGSSCTTNDECSSGDCVDSVCVSMPEIENISPEEGAPGNYVTISGSNFGSSTGTVYFTGADDSLIAATIPSCSEGWSRTEVIVEVPDGAVSGAITLITSTELEESTNDDNGALLNDFDVNEVVSPNLCRLTLSSGSIGDTTTLSGSNFVDVQGDSTILFTAEDETENEVRTYRSWADTSAVITVPTLSVADYSVTVVVDGVSSNALNYTLRDVETDDPVITRIDPGDGGIGQYVTISGTNFGSSTGNVWFVNQDSGYSAQGSIDFPDACVNDYWSTDEITIIVPDTYTNDEPIEETAHNVYVETSVGDSNIVEFIITDADPSPGLCAIDASSGEAGDTVTLYGEKLGTVGTATFYNSVNATSVELWSSEEITLTVPSATSTGPVKVTVGEEDSNTVNFEISEGEAGTAIVAASYGWIFSTGLIPDSPQLVVDCDLNDQTVVPSAVPNRLWSSDVCINAEVYGYFTMVMDQSTLIDSDSIKIEECTNEACSEFETVAGSLEFSDSGSSTSFTWAPEAGYNNGSGDFKISTTYIVTVSTNVKSSEGIGMEDAVSWRFTTGVSADDCEVEVVYVSPREDTIEEEGATTEFQALPSTLDCQVLDASDYTWDWELDSSYAAWSDGCGANMHDSCITVTALAEGQSNVVATEERSNIYGTGLLIIDYTDPYVDNNWPSCSMACTNAEVGASFNIPMSFGSSAGSVEAEDAFIVKECTNELCLSFGDTVATSADCDDTSGGECTEISANITGSLDSNTFYRVIISGEVASNSGVLLTRTNYGNDYSWIFSTKDDDTECAVDRISIDPENKELSAVGETQSFTVEPYGEPDECSSSGQRLSAYGFSWDWVDPIVGDSDVAELVKINSLLFNVDPDGIPEGCTSSCLATGSDGFDALCGNGIVETGEDCDDGLSVDGDGCSSECLSEGSSTCASADSSLCCGNGELEESATLGVLEECDDSNTRDGDGCSATCLNEGSRVIGATCANTDIAWAADAGGEDCADGNARSGDGCSSICLNEGSSALGAVAAVCGDGEINEPYETCDDGNSTNYDGCSSRCVREGSVGDFGTCGDGEVDQIPASASAEESGGEDCDGEEYCSSRCTLSGSSLSYSSPSVCGDGVAGLGELEVCEFGGSGDSKTDPVQMAVISETAPSHVNEVTELATATIQVSHATYDVSAEASLSLSCSAENEAVDCPDPDEYGVGTNSCCIERTNVEAFPNGENTCRNAAIYAMFDDEMDTATFIDNIVVELDTSTTVDGECPAEYALYTTVVDSGSSWFARVWNKIKSFFGSDAEARSDVACLLPVTSFTQTALTDGYKVAINYDVALEPNADYTIFIEGNTLTGDGAEDGVLSKLGVGLAETKEVSFTTASEICGVDTVTVRDTDTDSPRVFSQSSEAHNFLASAYSHELGDSQEIVGITGVYEWAWLPWQVDVLSDVFTVSSISDTAVVTSGTQSGEATVLAQVQVSVDAEGDDFASMISGTEDIIATLCENPWPMFTELPFRDNAEGESGSVSGITEGSAWTNFSTWYCMDAGEEDDLSDDLSDLVVVAPAVSESESVFKEYLLLVNDGSGDAIGIRIASNSGYEAPANWYYSRGFAGSPSETTVDNFDAVRDGRTTYVAAPNQSSDGDLYPNIYILSYNENASSDTIDIFNQILANMEFVVNSEVSNTNLCYFVDSEAQVQWTSDICGSDWDCDIDSGEVCGSEKDEIQRDMERVQDVVTIQSLLSGYGVRNGVCSETTDQICTSDAGCPDEETCNEAVPTLQSGTFVRAMGTSAWDSWSNTVAGAFGSTPPSDPLNTYGYLCGSYCEDSKTECSSDSDCDTTSSEACIDSDFPDYTYGTCLNETNGEYVCPDLATVYHYRSVGALGYELGAELEYDEADWAYAIDPDASDDLVVMVGGNSNDSVPGFTGGVAYCDGSSIYGQSNVCGDGVIGPTEDCELGDEGPREACDSNADGTDDGTIRTVCASDCSSGYITDTSAECTTSECGNGVTEADAGETCDDGSFNGRYGYCGSLCTYDSAFYCGDGSLAGAEVCDCGSSGTPSGRNYGGGVCTTFLNGVYDTNENNTCSWDCAGPASYCGDAVVDSGEECDGDTETYSGALCSSGTTLDGLGQCSSDSDCSFRGIRPRGESGVCGGTDSTSECATTTVCLDGDADMIGRACVADVDCDTSGEADGVCSSFEVETTRTRTCADDVSAGGSCTWEQENWGTLNCVAIGSCGDGTVDDGEECDDGNEDSSDDCTNECTSNVCGDGYLYAGIEDCDEGLENGEVCSSSYESTCTYCSDSCRLLTTSGSFCGDGVINGDEFCDAEDLPYYFIHSGTTFDGVTSYTNLGVTCDADSVGTSTGSGTSVQSCRNVGVCNGGEDNGAYCLSLSDCDGQCVKPSCSDSCGSSCPFTYDSDTLLIESITPGARRRSSVSLESYSETGDAATLIIPECTVATSLVADISYTDYSPPDMTYVVFVTDLSGSMGETLSPDTKLKLVKQELRTGIRDLFDIMGSDVMVSVVGYQSNNNGGSAWPTYASLVDGHVVMFDQSSAEFVHQFRGEDHEVELMSAINGYSAGGGTYTYFGLWAANVLMSSVLETDARKVIVLMTDGEWNCDTCGSDQRDPTYMACLAKDDLDVELFTVSLYNGTTEITSELGECGDYQDDDGTYITSENFAERFSDGFFATDRGGTILETMIENNVLWGILTADALASFIDSRIITGANIDFSWYWSAIDQGILDYSHVRNLIDYGSLTDADLLDQLNDGRISNMDVILGLNDAGILTPSHIESLLSGGANISQNTADSLLGAGMMTESTYRSFESMFIDSSFIQFGATEDYVTAPRRFVDRFTDFLSGAVRKMTGILTAQATSCTDDVDDLTIIQQMACWSSGNPDPSSDIDYAYDAYSPEGLASAYGEIFDIIMGPQITFVVDTNEGPVTVSGGVRDGTDIELPWPELFVCDPNNEQELPFRVDFTGTGSIGISNVGFEYCAP